MNLLHIRSQASRKVILYLYLALSLSGMSLVACQPFVTQSQAAWDEDALAASQYEPSAADTAGAQPMVPGFIPPTQIQASLPIISTKIMEDPIIEASTTPVPLPTSQQPLRFTFPIPGAEPISLWRPPLYPIPWEPTRNDHFYFSRPIGANEINWPLANYRYGGVFFEDIVHTGIDIPAPKGTPVMAAGGGTVIWAGYGLYFLRPENRDPYGLAVAIKHDYGYQGHALYTVYGHMDDLYAFQGQKVQVGDVIGIVGETGKVTGPHLHFEVRIEKNNFFGSRNPELWIAPPQGWGVVAARVMKEDGDLLYRQDIQLRNISTLESWTVLTYGRGSVNPDAFYRENMVIGDLPAGKYVVWIDYEGATYNKTIEVLPGKVTYFSFLGRFGYRTDPPKDAVPEFQPPDITPTPTIFQ